VRSTHKMPFKMGVTCPRCGFDFTVSEADLILHSLPQGLPLSLVCHACFWPLPWLLRFAFKQTRSRGTPQSWDG